MQVSVISADYGQITKALDSKHITNSNKHKNIEKDSYNTSLHKSTEKDNLYSEIQEWKNFCHQQILKGKLDIIA